MSDIVERLRERVASLGDLLAHEAATAIEARDAEIARLRGLLWFAWHEFNAIRARSGAPLTRDGMTTCTDDWWGEMADAFAEAIGEDACKPWPSPEARAALKVSP